VQNVNMQAMRSDKPCPKHGDTPRGLFDNPYVDTTVGQDGCIRAPGESLQEGEETLSKAMREVEGLLDKKTN